MRQSERAEPVCKTGAFGLVGANPSMPTTLEGPLHPVVFETAVVKQRWKMTSGAIALVPLTPRDEQFPRPETGKVDAHKCARAFHRPPPGVACSEMASHRIVNPEFVVRNHVGQPSLFQCSSDSRAFALAPLTPQGL